MIAQAAWRGQIGGPSSILLQTGNGIGDCGNPLRTSEKDMPLPSAVAAR